MIAVAKYLVREVRWFPETAQILKFIGPQGERPIERLKRETAQAIRNRRQLQKEA